MIRLQFSSSWRRVGLSAYRPQKLPQISQIICSFTRGPHLFNLYLFYSDRIFIIKTYFQRFVKCSPLGSHHCKISPVTNICEDWIIDHTKSCVHCTWRACSQAVVLHITKGSLITRRVTWLHALTRIQICDSERANKFILWLTVQSFTPNNEW